MTARVGVTEDMEVAVLVDDGRLREALTRLMARHGAAVYSRCLRIVATSDAARDVAQQTFLEAYRDLRGFERRSSFRTWLIGIATHRSLDQVRARRRHENRISDDAEIPEISDDDGLTQPDEAIHHTQRIDALATCLQVLVPEARAAVLLRFQDELSYEEMGTFLGEKPGTLQARVARAMPVLRRCLSNKGFDS